MYLHYVNTSNSSILQKFHTAPGIPNPDVVHMYTEEAGCTDMIENIPVNVGKGENRTPEFLQINPLGEVPALILDDGSCLTESIAIAKFLDDTNGFSSLYGTTPAERAEVDMWLMRSEQKVVLETLLVEDCFCPPDPARPFVLLVSQALEPIGSAFRNGPMFNFFKDRRPGYIHAEHVDGMKIAGQAGLKWFDEQLAGKEYLCGSRFTIADIRFYCLYSFYVNVRIKRI